MIHSPVTLSYVDTRTKSGHLLALRLFTFSFRDGAPLLYTPVDCHRLRLNLYLLIIVFQVLVDQEDAFIRL